MTCSLQEVDAKPQSLLIEYIKENSWVKILQAYLGAYGLVKVYSHDYVFFCFLILFFFFRYIKDIRPSCNDTIFFLWNDENNNVLNKYCDLVKCFPYYPKIKFLSSSHHHPFDQVKKKRQTKVFNTTTLCSSWWNK